MQVGETSGQSNDSISIEDSNHKTKLCGSSQQSLIYSRDYYDFELFRWLRRFLELLLIVEEEFADTN